MIVPALSNWIFFMHGHERHNTYSDKTDNPLWKDLGGYRGITEGRFVVARPCCYGSPRPLENIVRSSPREARITHLMKARSQGCAYPVALFCSDGSPIPIT